MDIKVKGETLKVTLPDGRTASVPFDRESSLLSRGGRAALKIATHMARQKLGEPKS